MCSSVGSLLDEVQQEVNENARHLQIYQESKWIDTKLREMEKFTSGSEVV